MNRFASVVVVIMLLASFGCSGQTKTFAVDQGLALSRSVTGTLSGFLVNKLNEFLAGV